MKQTAMMMLTLVLLALGADLGGCTIGYQPLQIEPVGKKTTAIIPKFTSAYYYYDRDQTLFFVMRSQTSDPKTKAPVEQIFTARVFWRPRGGKTSLNPASINTTYRYVLISADSVGMYEGAGFVRLSGKNGAKEITARLMDGDMRLTESSASFVDTLGRAHLKGNFTAKYDDARALDMLVGAQREFFAHSLVSKPKAAATQPGEHEEGFAIPEAGPEVTAPGTQPSTLPAK